MVQNCNTIVIELIIQYRGGWHSSDSVTPALTSRAFYRGKKPILFFLMQFSCLLQVPYCTYLSQQHDYQFDYLQMWDSCLTGEIVTKMLTGVPLCPQGVSACHACFNATSISQPSMVHWGPWLECHLWPSPVSLSRVTNTYVVISSRETEASIPKSPTQWNPQDATFIIKLLLVPWGL